MPRRRSGTSQREVAETSTALAVLAPVESGAPLIPTPGLVASAVRYTGKMHGRLYRPTQEWQRECYRHYGICGEAQFAAKFYGHALSRARIFAADRNPENGDYEEVAWDTQAADAVRKLTNNEESQAAMLNAIGQHLTIAGECYIIGRSGARVVTEAENIGVTSFDDDQDIFEVVGKLEVNVIGETWTINYADGRPPVLLSDDDIVIRIWLPHPERRIEADSPFRSLLPVLREIESTTMHIYRQIRSRLAANGLLVLSQGMEFPPPLDANGQQIKTTNDASGFVLTLARAIGQAIDDPSSPEAEIPITVTAPPGDNGQGVEHAAKLLKFWSELDGKAIEMRKDAIHRFALGMDLPPERILGMSSNGGTGGGTSNGVSHWGAWQIQEETITLHVEPMLDVVCLAITITWLRNAITDSTTAVMRYDTSKLRIRPDLSESAFKMYDRGEISGDALRRETGFQPKDKPSDEERQQWLLMKIAVGSATPEQVQAALDTLGVDLGRLMRPAAQPREKRPDPSLEGLPTRELPERPAANLDALVAACDALAYRALERAGNKLRNKVSNPPNARSFEVHTLVKANGQTDWALDDAFACAEPVIAGAGHDPAKVIPILRSYVVSLINEQSAHERTRLATWLTKELSA